MPPQRARIKLETSAGAVHTGAPESVVPSENSRIDGSASTGALIGSARRSFPGIDGTLDGALISLKEIQGSNPLAVLKRASSAEAKARSANYSGVELFVRAPQVSMEKLIEFAEGGNAALAKIPTQGTISGITVLTRDGWLRIPGSK
jgi:hypothetical protein